MATVENPLSVGNVAFRRAPLLALGIVALLAGLWSGLFRVGWNIPALQPTLPISHGPLMICGFLGTLISLERAVALGRRWAFMGPVLTGTGGILLITGIGTWQGPLLITLGSLVLLAVFGAVLRIQSQAFVWVMAAGALAWMVGNVIWLLGAPVFRIVLWWMGFLVLTIAGERLELSRMLMHAPAVQRLFTGIAALLGAGLLAELFVPDAGFRLSGVALMALAIWLARYDIARHTIRTKELTRYIAACLLAGYFWLFTGGLLAALLGFSAGGPLYDAILHAVLVGFVFSMIFGHAPIIFPSVLGTPVFYRKFFYVHMVLLHLSLLLRIAGDLAGNVSVRRAGAMLNAVAILLFLATTIYSIARARWSTGDD